MYRKGDRVELVRSLKGYRKGAEGAVLISHQDGNLTVEIDVDDQGSVIDPPDPLMPASSANFKPSERISPMYNRGDRVELVRSLQGYRKGAKGAVLVAHRDGNLTVEIDVDDQGGVVDPPDPLMPASSAHFKPDVPVVRRAGTAGTRGAKKKAVKKAKKKRTN